MRTALVALIALLVGGFSTALLYTYPKGETVLGTYCVKCGARHTTTRQHQTLGAESGEATRSWLLLPLPGHQHTWAEPAAHVFPNYASPTDPVMGTSAYLHELLLRDRLTMLETMEHDLKSAGALDAAFRADPVRAQRFVEWLLDPARAFTGQTLALLTRAGSWDEKWKRLEAFQAAYRCEDKGVSFDCTLKSGAKPALAVWHVGADGSTNSTWPNMDTWEP